tara:strand:+ start:456 stop:629 length:174 start_codon:yes stop_codon:yes gene_type:complete
MVINYGFNLTVYNGFYRNCFLKKQFLTSFTKLYKKNFALKAQCRYVASETELFIIEH